MITCKQKQLKLDLKEKGEATLFLQKDGDGICLMARLNGTDWFILTIDKDKPIKLNSSLPRDFIVPVDINGVSLVRKEGE